MTVEFRRQAEFTAKDLDLNRKLVRLENEVERALRALDLAKVDRFKPVLTAETPIQAEFGKLYLLDTAGQAINLVLPLIRGAADADKRVGVVVLSTTNAGVVYPAGASVLISGAASHTPTVATIYSYVCDGSLWWVRT